MNGDLVTIVKNGQTTLTVAENLQINDIVFVQAGDFVPADIQLVEASGLEIDEFELTGEVLPVIKKLDDHEVMLYMGSKVIRGQAKGIVVAVGDQTEFGKIFMQSWEAKNQISAFRILEKRSLVISGLLIPVFIILIAQGFNIILAITVILVVFSLLAVFQIDQFFKDVLLTTEQKKLERLNIQIRDPQALVCMRDINLICFDKTGVLTSRQLGVKNICYADQNLDLLVDDIARPSQLILLACVLCNEVLFPEKIALANPIDKALIAFAQHHGLDFKDVHTLYKRIYDLPFDSENRYMACGFESGDHQVYYFIKGAPEVIVNYCNHYLTSSGVTRRVDFEYFVNNSSNILKINQNGDTAIALAYSSKLHEQKPADMTFLCLLQVENSLQPGVRELIGKISDKRIRSILLTGDRGETAGRVGTACGISNNPRIYLTGRAIQNMATTEIARQSAYCSVFARLIPSQKAALIRILQDQGHTIAMVGDGPNDGIALKAADIGISFVSDSAPVARRLSKILITELSDILRLIEGSNQIHRRIGDFEVIRVLTIAGASLALFGSVVAWWYF